MVKMDQVVNTTETDGPFQINIYESGLIGLEHINGDEVKGNEEDLVFLIRELMPILRKPRH